MNGIQNYRRTAQYWETDQMGIIHHSNYVRWFEEARVDFMEQCGLSYGALEQRGILMPVLGVSLEYIKPARFADTVEIEMQILDFIKAHGVRFSVRYAVRNRETGELLTKGESRHCFTDRELRVVRVKRDHPDVYEVFAKMEGEGQNG